MNGQALLHDRLSDRDRAILALAAAGLTPGEISRLVVGDVRISPRMGLVRVRRTRGRRHCRYVMLDLAAASSVARWLGGDHLETRERDGRAPLFTSSSGGRQLSRSGVHWLLARLREPAA